MRSPCPGCKVVSELRWVSEVLVQLMMQSQQVTRHDRPSADDVLRNEACQ